VEQLFTTKREGTGEMVEQLFTAGREDTGAIDKGEGRNGNMEEKAGAR
jgi:hypothetical protein